MICPKCSKRLPDDSQYCYNCGTIFVNDPAANAAPQPAPQPAPQSAPQPTPVSAPQAAPAPQYSAPQQPQYTPAQQQYTPPQYSAPQPQYAPPMKKEITKDDLPEKYSPLGAWTYFALNLLFSIPIVGFIFLIIFSFNDNNINRRNYARSFWCVWAIVLIIFAVFLTLGLVAGVGIFAALG